MDFKSRETSTFTDTDAEKQKAYLPHFPKKSSSSMFDFQDKLYHTSSLVSENEADAINKVCKQRRDQKQI